MFASGAIALAPLKFVGQVNAWPPVPFCVMTKVIISPAVGFVTELDVTSPVSVIRNPLPALASNTGVAEKLVVTGCGKSAGTMTRAVTGPEEEPEAGPPRK